MRWWLFLLTGILVCGEASRLEAQSLRGSQASLREQHRVAQEHDFTFLETPADVLRFVRSGLLVELPGNADYELANPSYPYARPEVRLFVKRLAAQYRAACGEKLVVTSLTRPTSGQPSNAASLSVHPTGMAVDFRISHNPGCRTWLERTLVQMDSRRVINATRERSPPHYHVAVYPTQYRGYVERLSRAGEGGTTVAEVRTHRVGRGETLWDLARLYDTSVSRLKQENGLDTSRIYAGQTLRVPAAR